MLVHTLHGEKLSETKGAQGVLGTLDIVGHDAVLSTAVRMVAKDRNSNVTAFIAKIPVVGGINLIGNEGEKGRRDANYASNTPNMKIA